jgi:hypothetical protein
MKYFAIVPSNQFANKTPLAGVTEEKIWVTGANEALAEIKRQDPVNYVAKIFYVPGSTGGSSTGSVDELSKMVDMMMTWLSLLPTADRHAFSFHSNSGSGRQYILMLYGLAGDLAFAQAVGHEAANRNLFTYVNPSYRPTDLTYFTHSNKLGLGRTLLFETGEHQTSVDAAYLLKYVRFLAIMNTRAFLKVKGLLKSDGPVPSDVVVPAGAAFDKYRPGAISPPSPPPPTVNFPVLKYVAGNLMRDIKVGEFPGPYSLLTYPIHWAQNVLKTHSYKSGYMFTDRNGMAHDIRTMPVDGWWGVISEGAQKHFEADPHYDLNGKLMVVDGILDANDLAKMRTV